MTDLPTPSYEQTIEAIVRCDIPRGNIRIAYADLLQSDEITISDLGPLSDDKLRCLKGAVHPFYVLTLQDAAQTAAFYQFSEREDRPKHKSDALNWLRENGLLDRLPVFNAEQSLEDFAQSVEAACGLRAQSTLVVFNKSFLTLRPDALSMQPFEKSAHDLRCVSQMITASDAHEHGIRFVFIGNEAYREEEQE